LPPGKIAAVATYLEMPRASAPIPAAPIDAAGRWRLEKLAGDVPRYRALFASVGQPWLWFSRASMSDAQVRAIIDDPAVHAFAFVMDGRDWGMLELDFRSPDECELAFLGLVPDAIGQGLGQTLIAEAIRRAFAQPIARLWLHTCTLDHPSALPFYIRAGFRPFRRALEVADDPRLTGRMPRDAAPNVPLI
jgi:GNAT superfamily N-acetyltransferase